MQALQHTPRPPTLTCPPPLLLYPCTAEQEALDLSSTCLQPDALVLAAGVLKNASNSEGVAAWLATSRGVAALTALLRSVLAVGCRPRSGSGSATPGRTQAHVETDDDTGRDSLGLLVSEGFGHACALAAARSIIRTQVLWCAGE